MGITGHRHLLLLLALAVWLPVAIAGEVAWTLVNPTTLDFAQEPLRLDLDLPTGVGQDGLVVRADGVEVPWQLEELDGRCWAWVLATVPAHGSIAYTVTPGTPMGVEPRVLVTETDGAVVLDNGLVAARLPLGRVGDTIPGPVTALRLPDGRWVGGSTWHTDRALESFTAEVVQRGPLFAKVRLRYCFAGRAGIGDAEAAHADIDLTLYPGQRHLVIEESHALDDGAFWEFALTDGWAARTPHCRIFQGDPGHGPEPDKWPTDLTPLGTTEEAIALRYRERLSRIGDTLLWLVPRWNQSYWDGWFFAVDDGATQVAALAVRAGRWRWPHDNKLEVRVRTTGDYAGLRCPTMRGSRYWFLAVVPADFDPQPYVWRHAHHPLDKLVHDFITNWPGKEYGSKGDGDFWMMDPFAASQINPTGNGRTLKRSSAKRVGQAGNLTDLTQLQVMLHPDTYGSYWDYWSPENPNFYSDWISTPVNLATTLSAHPRFPELALKVQLAVMADLYFGVSLPGGAGQECPGYMGVGHWRYFADLGREYLGFDLAVRPHLAAAERFRELLAIPVGADYLWAPYGDTHNALKPYPVDPATLKDLPSQELPGFGAVFRRDPGGQHESHLAFKAGPNRGHYHGDQLAVLWCADRRYLLADHGCSYRPRPGQEHLHNRVAFSTPEHPYLNMDGYERLIACHLGDTVGIAVGQVESQRLRAVRALPPEEWHHDWPRVALDGPLVYRRTVVHVAVGGRDYVVLRDQYRAPVELGAACCFHVRDDATAALVVGGKDARGATSDGSAVVVDVARDFAALGVEVGWVLQWEDATSPYDQQERFVITAVEPHRLTLDRPVAAAEVHPYVLLRPRYVQEGAAVTCAAGLTLFCASPTAYDLVFLPWYHGKAGGEGTQGLRLETRGASGEFITVCYPSNTGVPPMAAIPGGVRVGNDEIVFAGDIDEAVTGPVVRVTRDGSVIGELLATEIDLDRSQGQVGLFVPDAGYPFGPFPAWLLAQRVAHPAWYHQLARIDRMRGGTDVEAAELVALARNPDPAVRGAALRVFATKGSASQAAAFREVVESLADPQERAWGEAALQRVAGKP